jgi:hypothetical protein
MTKHYELIDSVRGNIVLYLFVQMCVNMTDLTQLGGVGGGFVDNNRMVSFHILNRD